MALKSSAPRGETEKKIKGAARRLFTRNGYAATRTRDIAREADINLALLNYYFRSKQALFNIVMLENIEEFLTGVGLIVNAAETSLEEKIRQLVARYIQTFSAQPDLPLFLLNQVHAAPEKFLAQINVASLLKNSAFARQIRQQGNLFRKLGYNPLHLLINLGVLTAAPFAAAPIIKIIAGFNREQFAALMAERAELVPRWMFAMAQAKKGTV
jgi:AcrR family transcriptional regulator